jgi:Xaa-Pro aminopeptidase
MSSESKSRIAGAIARAQEKMREQGIARMFIGPGASLFYLTGIRAMMSERVYLLSIPANGQPRLILPTFERASAEDSGVDAEIIEWSDAVGPSQAYAAAVEGLGLSQVVAIDDQLWTAFFLDLKSRVEIADWVKASGIMSQLRSRKSKEEIATLKQAAAIADKTLAQLIKLKFSGRRESEIAAEIQRLLIDNGQEAVQFKIVGSGENGAKPHHEASERVIQPGDAIVLDFGGTYHGYQSDMTRMVVVKGGNADKDYQKVHDIVNEANLAARAAVRPGATCGDVDAAARAVITKAGYGEYFTHRTGHGIGIDVHEHPYIVSGSTERLDVGMAFSIEPGIYLPGRFGVRIEDIVVVTEHGGENINLSQHEVVFVE